MGAPKFIFIPYISQLAASQNHSRVSKLHISLHFTEYSNKTRIGTATNQNEIF